MDDVTESEWIIAGRNARKRFNKAFGSIIFTAYILVGVIFFGAMGIWLPALMSENTTWVDPGNHFTYSMALIFVLAVDTLITSSNSNNNELEEERDEKMIALGLIAGVIIIIFLMIGLLNKGIYAPCFSVLGSLFSVTLISIAQIDDNKFSKPKKDTPATGSEDPNKKTITNKRKG